MQTVAEVSPERVPDSGLQSLNSESKGQFSSQQNLSKFCFRPTSAVISMSRGRGTDEASRYSRHLLRFLQTVRFLCVTDSFVTLSYAIFRAQVALIIDY